MDPIAKMYLARDEDAREEVRNYRKPSIRFRASELADCKRKIWYRLSGYIPTPRSGFKNDWSIDGDIHHDMVRQTMLHWGITLGGITQDEETGETHENKYIVTEFEYDDVKFNVSSRQDGWIEHEDYDGLIMMEIKSVGHWPHNYMVKAYEEGGAAGFVEYIKEKKPEYVYQMNAGMAMNKDDHCYLVLKDRSNSHIGIHLNDGTVVGGVVFDYDPVLMEKIKRRCVAVKRAVIAGKPPMPEFTAGSKQCGYCPYYYACHASFKRKKAGLTPTMVYPDPTIDVGLLEDDDGNE